MLRVNGMTRGDVEIVEFPYPDDWYDDPKMLQAPMNNPSELWLSRDHKHDLAFRPLETALENGTVDAIYTQSKPFQHLQEDDRQVQGHRGPVPLPGLDAADGQLPAVITCTASWPTQHPELVVAYMKAMIKVGRWANEHKHAAAAILNKQTFYRDVEDTYQGIKGIDMVPNLSPRTSLRSRSARTSCSATATSSATSTCTMGRAGVPGEGGRRAAGRGVGADHDRQAARGLELELSVVRLG